MHSTRENRKRISYIMSSFIFIIIVIVNSSESYKALTNLLLNKCTENYEPQSRQQYRICIWRDDVKVERGEKRDGELQVSKAIVRKGQRKTSKPMFTWQCGWMERWMNGSNHFIYVNHGCCAWAEVSQLKISPAQRACRVETFVSFRIRSKFDFGMRAPAFGDEQF